MTSTRNDIRFDFLEGFKESMDVSWSKSRRMTFFKNLHVLGREYNIKPDFFAKYLDNLFSEKVQWSESRRELVCNNLILEKDEMYNYLRDFYNYHVVCQLCATIQTKFNKNGTLRYCKSCLNVVELCDQNHQQNWITLVEDKDQNFNEFF